jgi:hypothetical protein
MKRLSMSDYIGIGIILMGLVMTALILIASRPAADIESVTFQEIQPKPPSGHI